MRFEIILDGASSYPHLNVKFLLSENVVIHVGEDLLLSVQSDRSQNKRLDWIVGRILLFCDRFLGCVDFVLPEDAENG